MKYAVERIGYGKYQRYVIKGFNGTGTIPVEGKAYRTEQAAREAARVSDGQQCPVMHRLGHKSERKGGSYEN
jgi:hypothetical protein